MPPIENDTDIYSNILSHVLKLLCQLETFIYHAYHPTDSEMPKLSALENRFLRPMTENLSE